MELKLITSKSNNYSLKKALEVVSSAAKNKDENFLVVVPEKFSLSVEKLLLLSTENKAITNIQVVTLSRLLKKLVKTENNYLSAQAGIMVVKKIILENLDKLVCFKKTARTMGFAEQIYDTISQLKNSNISADLYDTISNGITTTLQIKLQDIFLLYKEYQNFISNEYIDACDRFMLLSSLIENETSLKDTSVFMVGFENMSESGYSVLETLLKTSKSLTVACADLKNSQNSYIANSEMYTAAVRIARENGIKTTKITFNESRSEIARHLSDNLFSYPYQNKEWNGEVEINETTTIREEVELVAEKIRKLIFVGGRYKDIAIACPNFKTYKDIISSVFADYEIPHFLDDSESLVGHPLSEFTLSALSVIRKNYAGEEVVLFAKNVFTGINIDRLSTFENYIIKYGINFDSFKTPFVYGRKKDTENLAVAESVRLEIIKKIKSFESTISSNKTAEGYLSGIYSLFKDFEINEKIKNFSEKQRQFEDPEKSSATLQAEEKINKLLTEATEILGDSQVTLEEYQAILASGMSAAKISFIPETIDSVFVGDVSTSKFFDIDHLFVVGAVDGVFPYTKDDCGIIVDAELDSMSENLSRKIEPSIKTINKREKYKVFELLQVPTKSLVVSYPTLSEDNSETTASYVVRDLQKIYYTKDSDALKINKISERYLQKRVVGANVSIEDYASEFSTLRVGQKKLFSAIRDYRNNLYIGDLEVINSLRSATEKRMSQNFKDLFEFIYTPKSELKLDNAEKLFFPNKRTSISELENYFSCPYKHYAEYGLKIKERDDASLKAVDVGNIMHKIAEYFVKDIGDISAKPEKQQEFLITKIIDRVLDKEEIASASNQYIIKPLKSEAVRMCNALIYQYQNSDFRPIGEEQKFGKDGIVPAIKTDSGINIEGKVDRIDVTNKKLRVVDYKTGSFDLAASEVYYGRKIQLFVYLKALEKYKNLKPIGTFYLPIKNVFVAEKGDIDYLSSYTMAGYFEEDVDTVLEMDKTITFDNPSSKIICASILTNKKNRAENKIQLKKAKHIMPAKMLSEIANYVTEISNTAIKEMLDGYIAPNPIEKGNRLTCDYCNFKFACGFSMNGKDSPRKVGRDISFERFVGGEDDEEK